MEGEDGLPLEFEFVAIGVDLGQTGPDLICEDLCCLRVSLLDQILENVAVELVLLGGSQHHLRLYYAHQQQNQQIIRARGSSEKKESRRSWVGWGSKN